MKLCRVITVAIRLGGGFCCAALLLFAGQHAARATEIAEASTWILIDTKNLTLSVHSSHNRLLARFHNVSIGSGGTTTVRHAGDSTTPLGTFHVAWINHRSPFRIFFGLDYPSAAYGERAYRLGIIGKADYEAILAASHGGKVPPQETPLGGRIGIHGLGKGDQDVQRRINWTDGCVALPNIDIESLAKWIHLGTRVDIL